MKYTVKFDNMTSVEVEANSREEAYEKAHGVKLSNQELSVEKREAPSGGGEQISVTFRSPRYRGIEGRFTAWTKGQRTITTIFHMPDQLSREDAKLLVNAFKALGVEAD